MVFYGGLYRPIGKKAFFIHQKTKDFLLNYVSFKKQRIFNQIAKMYVFLKANFPPAPTFSEKQNGNYNNLNG